MPSPETLASLEANRVSLRCDTLDDLDRIARVIARHLTAGEVVLLDGPLAVGKTALVSRICAHLGVPDGVSSPTYVIANTYKAAGLPILHIDAYRLAGADEFYLLGLEEEIDAGITLIEWGSRVAESFGRHIRLEMRFAGAGEDGRLIDITVEGADKRALLDELNGLIGN